MTFYQELLAPMMPGYDPRHGEAVMRLQYGTLNHLPREVFAEEAKLAMAMIDEDARQVEALAVSFGL